MSIYEDILPDVRGILAEFGITVELMKAGAAGGTWWDSTPGAPVPYSVKAVKDYQVQKDQSGRLTGSTMMVLYMEPPPVAPEKQDRVQVQGKIYEIAEVRPIEPADVPLLYECYIVL